MDFPDWVQGPTACSVRTYSVVLPAVAGHRSLKLVQQFPARPVHTVRHLKSGRLSTAWADGKLDPGFEIASNEEN